MKKRILWIWFIIFLLAACAPAVEAPESAVKARNAAIAYLVDKKPEMQLPAADAKWQARRDTPEKLLGYETYSFHSGAAVISVGCPVVAPWDVICAVRVQVGTAVWEGRVDAKGEVLEGLQ